MSYEFYKIIHLIGIVLLLTGLTGLLTVKMVGAEVQGKTKTLVFLTHGIGSLFILISGFGLLARLGLIQSLPGWVYGKLLIWLFFGGIMTVFKRKGQIGTPLYFLSITVFIIAAYLAVMKPF